MFGDFNNSQLTDSLFDMFERLNTPQAQELQNFMRRCQGHAQKARAQGNERRAKIWEQKAADASRRLADLLPPRRGG